MYYKLLRRCSLAGDVDLETRVRVRGFGHGCQKLPMEVSIAIIKYLEHPEKSISVRLPIIGERRLTGEKIIYNGPKSLCNLILDKKRRTLLAMLDARRSYQLGFRRAT